MDALFRNFIKLLRDGVSTLLVPWLGIAAVDLGFVAITIGVVVATGAFEPGMGAGWLVQLIAFVQVIAILTLRVALLNTLRDLVFQGPGAVGSAGAVARSMMERLAPSLGITLVVGALVSIGMVLCIFPGVVALFFLAFAPYLVAARKLPVGEALRTSAQWASREWVLLLTALVVAVVAVSIMACTMGVAVELFTGAMASATGGYISTWVLNTVLGYLAFLWWGAVYVTAEGRQQVESLRETAPDQPYREPTDEELEYYDPSSDSPSDSDSGSGGEW